MAALRTKLGMKLVVNTKNTFLEVEEVAPAGCVEPRSASCPPRCWKVKFDELHSADLDDEESTDSAGSFIPTGTTEGQKAWDTISDNDEAALSTRPPSPRSESRAGSSPESVEITIDDGSLDANFSPLSSPRRSSNSNDGDEVGDSPPSSPRKPRRRGRGRRSGKVEFSAELDKRQGGSHGIDIDWSSGTHLLIEKVNVPGLVAEWNEAHPEQEIAAGACIVEVNGLRGSADQLLQEMKKHELLQIKVRCQKRRSETSPTKDRSPERAACPSPQRTPLRNVLASGTQVPLFRPGASVSASSPSSPGLPVSSDSLWLAPQGMKPEFVEAVQALKTGLAASVPSSWSFDAGSATKVSFSVTSASFASNAVLSSVQQAILNIVVKFPSVFLMGRNANPFQALEQGELGFRVVLCSVSKDRFQRACWDTVGKGYCPRGCSCTWEHPQDSDLLEVRVAVKPVEQQFVCMPVVAMGR